MWNTKLSNGHVHKLMDSSFLKTRLRRTRQLRGPGPWHRRQCVSCPPVRSVPGPHYASNSRPASHDPRAVRIMTSNVDFHRTHRRPGKRTDPPPSPTASQPPRADCATTRTALRVQVGPHAQCSGGHDAGLRSLDAAHTRNVSPQCCRSTAVRARRFETCDEGVPAEAENGRDNNITRKFRQSCSPRAPQSYPPAAPAPQVRPKLLKSCEKAVEKLRPEPRGGPKSATKNWSYLANVWPKARTKLATV